jgi:hypothetical protein
LADTEHVTILLQREIYDITLNKQKRFKNEFSIGLNEFEAWWETIGIQELQKTIEHRIIHLRYPKMHLVSHLSHSIHQMGSGDNFTIDISERLHIAHVKEAYRSSIKVNYIRQMLRYNHRYTGLNYMEETQSYLALQGWYNVDCAKDFNLLSATENGQVSRELICYVSKQFRKSAVSALYHSRYII